MIKLDIAHRYNDRVGINARFMSDARIVALFGRSGSGKTSVVRAIAGMLAPQQGSIEVAGVTLFDRKRRINLPIERRGVGVVFQEGLLFPHLSVEQNLRYGARHGAARPTLPFEHVVDLLGISDKLAQRPSTLSGGEAQRVAIGRALLAAPRLLLMDEPLAGLDMGRRGEMLRLIERVRDEIGVRIVYVSHAIGEVTRLADEVVLMNEGEVLACDTTETIFNRADLRPHTGRFEGGALIEAVATAHDAEYFLTTFAFEGGELVAPGLEVAIGQRVRVRIRARDVSLSCQKPVGLSIRNVLRGDIVALDDHRGAIVEVAVQLGNGKRLLARVARKSADEMRLQIGVPVYALIKAIAFDKRSMGIMA